MIPLVAPTITNHDRNYVGSRIHTGLLDDDREVRRFEEAFAEYVGCVDAVAVCSGSVALELALRGRTGPTRIPTYTCVAVRNVVAEPVYVDGRFDVRQAQMTLENTTVVCHMFGRETVCADALVEDWTLSLAGVARLPDGRTGVCSTHATKMISTQRGGLVFSNDPAAISWVRDQAHYETHHRRARSVAMSALQAALGNSQLQQIDGFVDRRREIAGYYSERFRDAGIDCPDAGCGSVFFRYLIAVPDPAFVVDRMAGMGVECGRGVNPLLHRLDFADDSAFPGAVAAHNSLVSVPCHPSLTDKHVAYIADKIRGVCG